VRGEYGMSLFSVLSEMERHCKYDINGSPGAHVNAGELCGDVVVVKSRSQPRHKIDGGKYEAMQLFKVIGGFRKEKKKLN
jgi:hypothetical protein